MQCVVKNTLLCELYPYRYNSVLREKTLTRRTLFGLLVFSLPHSRPTMQGAGPPEHSLCTGSWLGTCGLQVVSPLTPKTQNANATKRNMHRACARSCAHCCSASAHEQGRRSMPRVAASARANKSNFMTINLSTQQNVARLNLSLHI